METYRVRLSGITVQYENTIYYLLTYHLFIPYYLCMLLSQHVSSSDCDEPEVDKLVQHLLFYFLFIP